MVTVKKTIHLMICSVCGILCVLCTEVFEGYGSEAETSLAALCCL